MGFYVKHNTQWKSHKSETKGEFFKIECSCGKYKTQNWRKDRQAILQAWFRHERRERAKLSA